MTAQPLLIELSTEELPPKALQRLGAAWATALVKELSRHHLVSADARYQVFASPRHLGARIEAVSPEGAQREVRLKGPSVNVGLDTNGEPTVALNKWAEKQGVALADLQREKSGKQENFFAVKTVAGAQLSKVINEVIETAINALPIPKLMQYQLSDGHTTISFVRPAHHLIALHGSDVINASALGLKAGRHTYGHRFTGATVSDDAPDRPIQVEIDHAANYESAMREARVLVDFNERRTLIETQLHKQADSLGFNLGNQQESAQLLDEVTALVEWPAVYVGTFEEKYLQVPPECLILTMRTNQKYFPLFDGNGRLTNKFLICSNLQVDDPSLIIDGNERVVRPRLADAEFFFNQDRKTTLSDRCDRLNAVVYHAKLGSQAQRSERVSQLATQIATMLGLSDQDKAMCKTAALLAKTDLLTDMVGEFPELQGIMGTYYARNDGEPDAVARAMTEQYQPRFAGDELPQTQVGTVLALADKLETLAGLFSIGQRPTGDKDPFALRRHALGVLRMLTEKKLPVSLTEMLQNAGKLFSMDADSMRALTDFVYERLIGYLREAGHVPGQIQAVVEQRPDKMDQINERLAAVAEFSRMPESQALASANKRIGNILRKSDDKLSAQPDPTLFELDAERALFDTINKLSGQVEEAVCHGKFTEAMSLMAQAREPVDRFFDDVMVMAEDKAVRENRLLMLRSMHQMMNRVADISRLAGN
ncbi:MAG: glycine--tRNA ligase subunit beta [Burkholderiaceae bacterium]